MQKNKLFLLATMLFIIAYVWLRISFNTQLANNRALQEALINESMKIIVKEKERIKSDSIGYYNKEQSLKSEITLIKNKRYYERNKYKQQLESLRMVTTNDYTTYNDSLYRHLQSAR